MKAQSLTTDAEETEDETSALAEVIAQATWERKGLNTVVIDLRGRVSYTDFVVVTTGTSGRHVQALARAAEDTVREWAQKKPYGKEGMDGGSWVLVDFGDVILHVFNGPVREDYDLERMWPDAPRMELEEKPNELYGHFELDEFENEGG